MTAPTPGRPDDVPESVLRDRHVGSEFTRWRQAQVYTDPSGIPAEAFAAGFASAEETVTELPKVLGHPDDFAEEWLDATYEPVDSPVGVSYDREAMITAHRAGWQRAREQIARFGKDPDGRWRTLEPQPAPGESSPLGLKHAVTSNRLGHALAALREIAEPSGGEFPRDAARNALDSDAAIRDNVALTWQPQSAPEMAAVTREVLTEVLAWLGDPRLERPSEATLKAWRERAGLPS